MGAGSRCTYFLLANGCVTRFTRFGSSPSQKLTGLSAGIGCRSALCEAEAVAGCAFLRALGLFDEALPFLERTPPSMFSPFYFLPIWDGVRDDPRFRQLIARLGCEAEYRTGRETLTRMLRERNTNDAPRIR